MFDKYNDSSVATGNMILIKDRHFTSSDAVLTFFHFGKYDTYKGSTLGIFCHTGRVFLWEI